MCEYPDVIDISVDDLCNEVVNNVINEQDYTTCTVVADNKLATKLVHKILAIKDSFDLVTDCKTDMLGFYYMTVSSDCKLYCEPVCHNNVPFIDEASMTYVQENVPESLMKYFISDFKLIFGIGENKMSLDDERNRLTKECEKLSKDYKNITEFLNLVKAAIKSEHPNMSEREVGMLAVNTVNSI